MLNKYYFEIKNRIFLLLLAWVSTILISYQYKEIFLFLFIKPSKVLFKETFIYFIFTNLTEVFSTYINLSYFIGNQIFLIYFIYNILIFFAPGMYFYEYKNFLLLFFYCLILWWLSILCLNTVLLPISFNFFFCFQETVTNQAFSFHYEARINEYLYLYFKIYYIWCLNSQFLVFFYLFLEYFKNDLKYIKKLRKIFYLVFLIIATIITPPDILSQVMLALSIVCVYEMMIVIIFLRKNFLNFN
jgi:sec-independent protein translocase protein TatC